MSHLPPLPEGWEEVQSRSRPGEISYHNTKDGRRFRVRPTQPADAAASPSPTPASAVASRTPNQMITTTTAPTPDRSAITTTASNPGDAPFKIGKNFEEPSSPKRGTGKPRDRELYFYVQILSFGNIKVTEQTFDAYFYVKAAWCEPEIERELDGEDGMRKKMDEFNKQADPIKWPEGLFNPRLDFMNSTGEDVKITKPELRVAPWRTGPNDEPIVEYAFFGRGTFIESLELNHFPFDLQPLRISISTSVGGIKFEEDKYLEVQSVLRPDFLVNPEFRIKSELEITHENGKKLLKSEMIKQPILEAAEDTFFSKSRGKPIPILQVAVIAQRIPDYYVWNIFFLMFLIVCMQFSAFVALDPIEAGDRFSVTLTLTLVAVAYKYVVADYLPHLSYFTLCDEYIMASFCFLWVGLVQNGWSGYLALQEATESELVDDDADTEDKFAKHFNIYSEWTLCAAFFAYNLYFIKTCRGAFYKTKNQLKDKAKIMELAGQPRGDETGDEKASGCFSKWTRWMM